MDTLYFSKSKFVECSKCMRMFWLNKTKEIPNGCFGLAYHISDSVAQTTYVGKDYDRFVLAPLEYVIIFEKEN